MNLDQGTATVIGLIVIIGLVIADVVLALDEEHQNTPSEIIRWVSRYTAVVPFGLGVLMGHWFHPNDDLEPLLGSRSPLYLLILGLLVGVAGPILGFRERRLAAWPWALAGSVLGAALWPV